MRRDVDWAHYRSIVVWAVPGVIAGAWVVRAVAVSLLQIIIGSVVVFALVVSAGLPRLPYLPGPWPRRVAGVAGGLLNATAGIAAPAMVLHANVARIPQPVFAATMQPIFATLGFLSVTTKTLLGSVPGEVFPPWWMLPALAVAVMIGSQLGAALAGALGPASSRRVAMALALAGGTVVLLRGLGVL